MVQAQAAVDDSVAVMYSNYQIATLLDSSYERTARIAHCCTLGPRCASWTAFLGQERSWYKEQ